MDNRFNQLLLYLENQKISTQNLVAIKSDASFRKYYRLENNILIMDAASEKGESVSKFSEISEILHSFNLSAPKIIDVNKKEGFILLEDFGEKIFSKYMNKENKKDLYKKAIDVLIDIKIKSHQNKSSLSKLAIYDFEELFRESILFIDWFIEQKLRMQISNKKRDEFYQILHQAFLNIKSQNDTLVLRDYHVDNLILKDHKEPLKQVGLIDFQDALLGSSFYDLASLLEDVRMPLNENEKEELLKYYINMTNENYEMVLREINFFSLQRNLKILGIFNRLSIRDGKARYLEYLPATFNFIKSNLKSSLFFDMKKWIEELQIKELQT
jgi:aminoglycoside/choline kinase family phosphotransferase